MALSVSAPQLIITANDEVLNRRIIENAVLIGRSLAIEFKEQMRLLVQAVVAITPPASGKLPGAMQQGRAAIRRDLGRMGFIPVEIKGERKVKSYMRPITKAFGREISPIAVRVSAYTAKTHIHKDEPATQADVDLLHYARLVSKHSGRVTRGRAKAWHIRKSQVTALLNRLYAEVGTLAAGWVGLAQELGLKLPDWITRHAGKTPYNFKVNFDANARDGRLFIYAVIHAPETVDPKIITDTQRRIEAAKGYRADAIKRGIEGRMKYATR